MSFVGGCKAIVALVLIVYYERKHEFSIKPERNKIEMFVRSCFVVKTLKIFP